MLMQKLLDVQQVDLKIKSLETEVGAIPSKFQELDNVLDIKKAAMEELKSAIDEIKKTQRQLERQLEQKQVDIAKYNSQLPMIKTNREYKAILVEIDSVEKEISDLEEEVLSSMTEIEEIEAKMAARQMEVAEAEAEAKEEKEKLERQKKELKELLEGTQSERMSLVSEVDKTLLSQYDRIRIHKGGLALSRIEDESCGACHMALPPQVVNEVIGGTIKSCPSCNRLLYWNEE